MKGDSALKDVLYTVRITEEDLLRAALTDIDKNCKSWTTKRQRGEDREEIAIDLVWRSWLALRDAYIEELTITVQEHYEQDRLARHAMQILDRAIRRYGRPFEEWEYAYCEYWCEECLAADGCDKECVRDELLWLAAGTIATILFLWQEWNDTLPFPSEPDAETVKAYFKAHPNLKSMGNSTVMQMSLF